jgi:hypothetical protein
MGSEPSESLNWPYITHLESCPSRHSPTDSSDEPFFEAGPEASTWQWDRTNHTGFESFVKATGNDRHSRFADPRFVNPAKNDFRLQTGSPAREAGTNLESSAVGARDLNGAPRIRGSQIDIGCYEK